LIYRWHQRFTARLGQVLLPFVAGGILLGITGGFDNPQTDGLAHVMGFLSGLALGLFAAIRFAKRESSLRQ
jgi:membrane associated rhomboid family serine protease